MVQYPIPSYNGGFALTIIAGKKDMQAGSLVSKIRDSGIIKECCPHWYFTVAYGKFGGEVGKEKRGREGYVTRFASGVGGSVYSSLLFSFFTLWSRAQFEISGKERGWFYRGSPKSLKRHQGGR